MMTTTRRVPFGDISNKENLAGTIGLKKTAVPHLPLFHTNSQEDKEIENELTEQVRSRLGTCTQF